MLLVPVSPLIAVLVFLGVQPFRQHPRPISSSLAVTMDAEYISEKDGQLEVSVLYDDLSEDLIEQLMVLYEKNWWAKGRTLEDVTLMLRGPCLTIALVSTNHEDDKSKLVGFARIITDFVFKALIFDVIVDEQYQGNGLGRKLIDAICSHSKIQTVKHLELYCLPEMESFYHKWGFDTESLGRIQLMRKIT